MNKKSKIVSVKGDGTWTGKYGIMYKFEVEMENGDIGEYSSKSEEQTKFIEGETTEYEFIDGNFPKIKPISTFNSGGFSGGNTFNPKREELIVKQCALKASVDLAIAKGIYTNEDILGQAELFTNWVLNRNQDNPFS